MAKKPSSNQVKNAKISPGSQKPANTGKSVGKVLGCICLMAFVLIDQLWLVIAFCAAVFAALYGIQVFWEKSAQWYSSGYLYATALCGVLSYLEYSSQLISKLLNL